MAAWIADRWLWKGISSLVVLGAAYAFAGDMPSDPDQPGTAAAQAEAPVAARRTPAPIAAAPSPLPSPAPAAAPILALAGDFAVQGVLAPDRPMGFGDYTWEDANIPQGELRIVVDLTSQRLYAYRGGIEIGRAAILYGADDKPTPTGTFKILQKKKDHVSNLYGAPMPYMLRLTNDGIAIHGSEVEEGYATHGCIGIPDEFAALLFREAQLGSKVLITNGWMRETYSTADVPANEA
jgi:lipoprotein-anchoring transpeptidase ErfK/SrfK